MVNVLLSDAGSRVSLCLTRALSRAGHSVGLFEVDRRVRKQMPPAFRSAGRNHSYILPDPDRAPRTYFHTLLNRLYEYDVFLPVATNTIYFCSTRLKQLQEQTNCRIPLVHRDTLEKANNTKKLLSVAKSAGIPVPDTIHINLDTPPDSDQIPFPSVLKLVSDHGLELSPGARYRKITNPSTYRNALQHFRTHTDTLICQKWIDGTGYGYSAVFVPPGNVQGSVCHRRIREYPLQGGPSALCETVRNEQVRQFGEQLLQSLNWYGPAQVEFRRSRADDQFYLMEVNPRFWGSLPLSLYAGLNLPDILVKSLFMPEPSFNKTAEPGRRLRFLHLDIPASLQQLRRGNGQDLADESLVSSWLNLNVGNGLFDIKDPVPAFSHYTNLLSSMVQN